MPGKTSFVQVLEISHHSLCLQAASRAMPLQDSGALFNRKPMVQPEPVSIVGGPSRVACSPPRVAEWAPEKVLAPGPHPGTHIGRGSPVLGRCPEFLEPDLDGVVEGVKAVLVAALVGAARDVHQAAGAQGAGDGVVGEAPKVLVDVYGGAQLGRVVLAVPLGEVGLGALRRCQSRCQWGEGAGGGAGHGVGWRGGGAAAALLSACGHPLHTKKNPKEHEQNLKPARPKEPQSPSPNPRAGPQ